MVALIANNGINTEKLQACSSTYNGFGFFVFLAAFTSLFFPSSIDGVIINFLSIFSIVISAVLLLIYSVRSVVISINVVLCLVFFSLLIFFTMGSRLDVYTPGAIFPYMAMWLVLMVVPPRSVSAAARKIFHLMAFFLIVLGVGVVFHIEPIRVFISDYYQAYSDDMYYFMIEAADKPVGPLATHSVSAFVYSIFSVIYFRLSCTNSGIKSVWFFLFSVSFFLLIVLLKSFSAIALSIILLAMYSFYLLSRGKFFSIGFILLLVSGVLFNMDTSFFYEVVDKILSSDGNGLRGRFVSGNRLEGTYEYILAHPLMAIGLTASPEIAFGDNFIADYVIRTGALGYLVVLAGVFSYFTNCFKSTAVILFCVGFVLLSDLGYPFLTNYRSVFLVPVFVAMWRSPKAELESCVDV